MRDYPEDDDHINRLDFIDEFIKGCRKVGGKVGGGINYTGCRVGPNESVELWRRNRRGSNFARATGYRVSTIVDEPTKIEVEKPPENVDAPTLLRIKDNEGNDITIRSE